MSMFEMTILLWLCLASAAPGFSTVKRVRTIDSNIDTSSKFKNRSDV